MKILTLACLLLGSLLGTAYAAEVSAGEAETVARSWMIRQGHAQFRTAPVNHVALHSAVGRTAFYIVSFMPSGFVIVAGDDASHPVLMYSDTEVSGHRLPPQLASLLDPAAEEIVRRAGVHAVADPQTASLWDQLRRGDFENALLAEVPTPLLQTRWNQSGPYNKFCPEDAAGPSGHCYAGCGAVALAQVLRYYRAPIRGKGSHAYTHPRYGTQSADFEVQPYLWDDMPERLYSSSPEYQIDLVAGIMYHCGVAVDMNYGPDGSGSSVIALREAFVNHFRFKSTAALVERRDYPTEDWLTIMRNELDAERPVIYSGNNSSTGAGHFFILDGYDSEGYFHCNWGWGGSYDGWFYLHDLSPGSRKYDINHDALVGLAPIEWISASTGTTYDLLAVDAEGRVVWACGKAGSVLRSIDAGWTWTPVSSPSAVSTLHDIAAVDGETAWVLGVDASSNTAIWCTRDGGQSWTEQLRVTDASAQLRAVSFRDADNGVACGDPSAGKFCVWRTTDGGDSWTPVPESGIPDALSGEQCSWNSLSRSGETLFFGTVTQAGTGRVLCSTDDGVTWGVHDTHSGIGRAVYRTAAASPVEVWALGFGGAISASTDGGMTWNEPVNTGVAGTNALASGGAGILAAAGDGGALRYSTDAGVSWFDEAVPTGAALTDLDLSQDGNCWIVGEGGTIVLRITPSPHVAPPAAPLPKSPADAADDITIPATLEWHADERAWKYEIQVSAQSDFSDITYQRSNIISTSSRAYYLDVNTTYYWRVRAENSGGPSTWSEVWSFHTVPGKPVAPMQMIPIDGAVGEPENVTLTWLPVDGASRYHLQVVYREFGLFVTRTEEMQLVDTAYVLTALDKGVKYYWRLRAANGMGYSAWTSYWTFTTMPLLVPPVLLSPGDQAVEIPLAPSLEWKMQEGIETYHIQVATDEQFETIVWENSQVTQSPLGLTKLQALTRYFWRVRGLVGGVASPWSAVWSFTTCAALPAPTLLSPADSSISAPVDVTLSWSTVQDAEGYTVHVARDALFSDPVMDEEEITDPTYVCDGLNDTTRYYWRVRADCAYGCSLWSATWTFRTFLRTPAIPELQMPEDSAADVPLTCTFLWLPAERSDSYRLQISEQTDFSDLFCDTSELPDPACVVTGLRPETRYVWRVSAANVSGMGEWSAVRSFTTGTAVGVFDGHDGRIPAVLSLRNHPNPFTNATVITFYLTRPGSVEIRIFDLLGTEIWKFAHGRMAAGRHDVYFPAATLPPGMYISRCISGRDVVFNRLVHVK